MRTFEEESGSIPSVSGEVSGSDASQARVASTNFNLFETRTEDGYVLNQYLVAINL
jgi:hypothetical protein